MRKTDEIEKDQISRFLRCRADFVRAPPSSEYGVTSIRKLSLPPSAFCFVAFTDPSMWGKSLVCNCLTYVDFHYPLLTIPISNATIPRSPNNWIKRQALLQAQPPSHPMRNVGICVEYRLHPGGTWSCPITQESLAEPMVLIMASPTP